MLGRKIKLRRRIGKERGMWIRKRKKFPGKESSKCKGPEVEHPGTPGREKACVAGVLGMRGRVGERRPENWTGLEGKDLRAHSRSLILSCVQRKVVG